MKKWTGIFSAAILCLMAGTIAKAKTPEFFVQESMTSRKNPQVICLNALMGGELVYDKNQYSNDEDYYRMILPKSGELTVSVCHDYLEDSDTCCEIKVLLPGTDAVIWESEIPGNITEISCYPFYLEAGEYDVVVAGRKEDCIPYQMMFSYREEENIEKEWNNTPETASDIKLNTIYQGVLNTSEDQDFYAFLIEEPGEVIIDFNHEFFDNNDTHYQLTLVRETGGEKLWSCDSSGTNASLSSNEFFLDKGKYYFKINSYYYTSRPYSLCVHYDANQYIELENNNSFEKATDIPTNKEVSGAFSVDNDVDWFHFSLDKPGEVSLIQKHEFFDSGDTHYRMGLYSTTRPDSNLAGFEYSGRDSESAEYPIYLPEGDYYLKCEPYYWSTVPYAFFLKYTPMDAIEREENDSYNSATKIEVNRDYIGSLMNDNDIDYYTFTLDKLSEVTLQFSFDYFKSGDTHFRLYLDTDTRSDTRYFSEDISGEDSEIETGIMYLPSGTYYFQVTNYYYTNRPYTFRINAEECTDAEEEWNNTYATANPIQSGQDMKGTLRYKDDIDCYVLDLEETSRVRIRFRHEWEDFSDTNYRIYLDAQPNSSNRLLEMNVHGKDADMVSDYMELPAGRYYLTVGSYYYSSVPYVLTVEKDRN